MKGMIFLTLGCALVAAASGQSASERLGGMCAQPNSRQGSLHVINAQDALDESEIKAAFATLAKDGYAVSIERGDPKAKACELAEKAAKPSTVVAVSNPDLPPLIAAPERHWAIVNIAALSEGLKTDEAKKRFVPSRFRKELLRAFVLSCGTFGSSFSGNILSCPKISDLDLVDEFVPEDALDACRKYLAKSGVKPERRIPYAMACKEGWAPAPTNDVQKKIVEKLQDMKERGPQNGLKIKPPAK